MNFGFITTVLKDIGKAVLPVAEDAGIAAANAALPGLGGTLAQIAISSITAAVTKHGTAPASTPSPSDPTLTVGQAKKLDVMQTFEAAAPDIMNAILAGRNKAVIDRAGFVAGTDQIVEGFLTVMKSIGAVPSNVPPVDPMVITPAVIEATKASAPVVMANAPQTPVGTPSPALRAALTNSQSFTGLISNLGTPTTADIVTLLEGLLTKLKAN